MTTTLTLEERLDAARRAWRDAICAHDLRRARFLYGVLDDLLEVKWAEMGGKSA